MYVLQYLSGFQTLVFASLYYSHTEDCSLRDEMFCSSLNIITGQ